MIYALADFGSTFTKVSVVDASEGRLLAATQFRTTIDTDVFDGFEVALKDSLRQAGLERVDRILAASSAAGGLRMAAVGLVDDLTASAAKRSALSAGAKVEGVWSGRLGQDDASAIEGLKPDLILFAGGTDGGQRDRVLANARVVAQVRGDLAVVVACNADIGDQVATIFVEAGHETVLVDNVLPSVDKENSAPAREAIRELFIDRVVKAKGLSDTAQFFDSVIMPTPAAVLSCAELIAGIDADAPAGSVVIVDVGGATTDVHSVNPFAQVERRTSRRAPAAAISSRTVEGDLGVRWNADSVYEQDAAWFVEHLDLPQARVEDAVRDRKETPSFMASTPLESRIDRALASSCITAGVARHVGRLSTQYIPGEGANVVLDGRDLRDARVVLVTGGSIVRDSSGAHGLVTQAMGRLDSSRPAPRDAEILIDHRYVLASAGLLATVDSAAAALLLESEVAGLREAMA